MAEVSANFPLRANYFAGGASLTPDQAVSLVNLLNDLAALAVRLEEEGTWIEADLAAEETPANGGMLSVANPLGVPLIILDMIVDVTTQATGAATADVGVAANGTTSSDTILDGIDIGTGVNIFNPANDGGTNGKKIRKWAITEFVTGTASLDSTGLVGKAHIKYRKETLT